MVLNKTSKLEGDRRVAAQVRPGERMLVPFAGVGPFAIPIAARKAEVIALEKSREACRWLAENVRRNGVEERTAVLNADAEHMAQMLKLEFDRAVIPAPYGMDWRFSSTAGAET
jgi:tRNA (guanine37-N1)-methyltransferase